ncbi:hypothetical protein ONV78_05555 [Hahella sp. CR1]|uniref:DUF6776 family protein n=1 Tax=Hahella sp. CR1 TaxID=2992807 RepID=UPI0024431A71|nr:DUF6776 family protein [Hahella sp. CR1]MDG9667196.1 hypothetical protein [Hahella sp. CR1]
MSTKANEKLVVVPYRPGETLKKRALAWLAIIISITGGIAMGWYFSDLRKEKLGSKNQELNRMLVIAERRATELAQQVANLERGKAIDQAASTDVLKTIRDLESANLQLREDIAFYKNIMAPSDEDTGLQVQRMEIRPTRENRRFQYKLVLTQVADNKTYIQGVVAVNLIGVKGGEKEILPLRDVDGAEELGVKFRFRYFQDLTGEMELPEGFVPEQIQVVAQSTGKKATKIERTFDWKVGE